MPESSGAPTYMGAIGRFVAERVRGKRPGPAPDRRVALTIRGLTVPPRRLHGYLSVTRGEGIPAFGPAGVLPPTITAIWESACAVDLLRMAGLPLPARGFLPLRSERVQLRTLASTEPLALTATLRTCEPCGNGLRLRVEVALRNRRDQLCSTSDLSLFVRGAGGSGPAPEDETSASLDDPTGDGWRTVRGWTLEKSLGLRYARISGDFSPVHLSATTARLVGCGRQVLHGGCIEALIANALIEGEVGGDPSSLRRLASTFVAPLGLPARVTLQTRGRAGGGAFRLMGSDDDPPLVRGDWVG